MPFTDIAGLTASSTFSDLFNKNNDMITRLNQLDVGYIIAGTGVSLSSIGSTGGVTLSVDLSSLATDLFINNTAVTITGSLPSGLTLGGIVGSVLIAGDTYGWTSCNNSTLSASNRMIGIVSAVSGTSSWKISTAGIIELTGSIAGLTQHSLHYLNTGGTYTSTIPTTENTVIKPVLYTFGTTSNRMGLIINSPGTLIPTATTTTSNTSSSRSIAEIYGGGVSAGNAVYYNVAGATWNKSIANDYAKAEVFGIVESITGLTATVVIHGSIKLPTTEIYDIGDGGSGGNDIYFLSGITAGAIQNSGPTLSGTIVKPLYTVAPHSLSGITFTGIVVNYIGYRNN
jgi:hypothetical protein